MSYKRKHEETATEPESESGSESETEEEDIGKVLEPFSKEQLIDLLRSAAAADPGLVAEIHRMADVDPAHRKLFVHGLGWETTSDRLCSFFAKYGELEECNVVAEKATGKSKGYGFVLFKHRSAAQKALRNPQKRIESRMTACQLASIGPTSNPHHFSSSSAPPDNLARKIYVGNVNPDISSSKLHAFFSKYGEIEEGPIGFDKNTGKSKGFALFVYKTVESAKKALEEPNKNFEGHQLYCQRAADNSGKPRGGGGGASASASAGAASNPHAQVPSGYNTSSSNGGAAAADTTAALFGQGLLAGAIPFNHALQANPAALAVLAAAGQNPAAFGVPPAMLMNPAALAAAMAPGAGNPQMVTPAALQGYGMGAGGYHNSGYQNMVYPTGAAAQPSNAFQGGAASFQGNTMVPGSTPGPRPSGVGAPPGYGTPR